MRAGVNILPGCAYAQRKPAEVEMESFSLSGNSQQLAGGAMVARTVHGPHPVLRARPPVAPGFVPDEFVLAEA